MNTGYCRDCKFFIKRGEIWYDQFCGASRKQEGIDPVTGVKGFVGRNDFGMQYIDNQEFMYARDINKGSCILYEKKP